MDANAGGETMPSPPDCERVPSAGVVAGSPDAGRVTMPIPPNCERVPDSGISAGVTNAGISIPPNRIHILGVSVATDTPDLDRENMPIPLHCERVPANGGDSGDPFFVRFYVDDGNTVEVRFFQDGCRLRRAMESLAADYFQLLGPAVHGAPPC